MCLVHKLMYFALINLQSWNRAVGRNRTVTLANHFKPPIQVSDFVKLRRFFSGDFFQRNVTDIFQASQARIFLISIFNNNYYS